MAEEAAGRSVSYDRVWIEGHEALNPQLDGYSVYFILPRTEGFFICNQRLDLEAEEYAEYEQWRDAQH